MQYLQISRREMMLNCARAVGGFSLAGLATSCQPSGSELARDKSSKQGFKIGSCDWSLGKSSDPRSFEVAKRIGLDGVQVNIGNLRNDLHLRRPDVQKTFLQESNKNGMEIASLCILDLNGVPYKSDLRTEQWVADSIDVCKAMAVKVVMLPFFGKGDLRDDEKGIATVVERLRRVAPKAEKGGVIIGLESLLSAEQHMNIINRVGSPAVQVYYDLGNSHKMGYDIYKEIRFLGNKHLCEFHAKDYRNLFGQGKIDFNEVRRAMDDIGYRGWIQIEGAKPLGLEASYGHNAQYLRSIFPQKV
jgi:sugar phosphate isomerase/epimerase